MSFENVPFQLSLFDDSGKMIANKKTDCMEKLETLINPNLILKELIDIDYHSDDKACVINY